MNKGQEIKEHNLAHQVMEMLRSLSHEFTPLNSRHEVSNHSPKLRPRLQMDHKV